MAVHIIYGVVLSLAIKQPLIKIEVSIQLVTLLDNPLVFAVELRLGRVQPSGDFRKTAKIIKESLTTSHIPTFNPTSKRWEPDTTPESGHQQLPAANVIPPTTPSAAQPSVPPSPTTLPALPIMQGAFFNNGYGAPPPNADKAAQKQAIAQQMIHLKQVYESM